MDTLEVSRDSSPTRGGKLKATGVQVHKDWTGGKDSSYQAGADSREQRVANLSAQMSPFNSPQAHAIGPVHKAVLHAN